MASKSRADGLAGRARLLSDVNPRPRQGRAHGLDAALKREIFAREGLGPPRHLRPLRLVAVKREDGAHPFVGPVDDHRLDAAAEADALRGDRCPPFGIGPSLST